jgi:cytoskeletal protein RodZ
MPSFGEQLKREREKRSITLDDISVSTKISTRLLRALEEDHFEQLPGGIFNKGFVRAYAKSVGLDADQIVADYLVAAGEDQPVPTPLPEPPPRREEVDVRRDENAWSVPWGSLAVVLLLAALGLAFWRNRHREETTDQPAATPVPQASMPAPAPVAAAPTPESAATTTAAAEPITIVIRAREDCWLTLTSDGKPVFEGMLTAGGVKKISAQHGAVVKAGNVGAVDISFNGNKVPTDGQAGQVKSFSFDESGLSTVTSSTTPATN